MAAPPPEHICGKTLTLIRRLPDAGMAVKSEDAPDG